MHYHWQQVHKMGEFSPPPPPPPTQPLAFEEYRRGLRVTDVVEVLKGAEARMFAQGRFHI